MHQFASDITPSASRSPGGGCREKTPSKEKRLPGTRVRGERAFIIGGYYVSMPTDWWYHATVRYGERVRHWWNRRRDDIISDVLVPFVAKQVQQTTRAG